MHSRRGVAMLGITLFFGVTLVPNAQSQSDSQGYEKWLDCDVDWIFNRETVGPSFSLKVSFHGAPIAESRITLNKDGKAEATARTNDRGVARFEGLAPGNMIRSLPTGYCFPREVSKLWSNPITFQVRS